MTGDGDSCKCDALDVVGKIPWCQAVQALVDECS